MLLPPRRAESRVELSFALACVPFWGPRRHAVTSVLSHRDHSLFIKRHTRWVLVHCRRSHGVSPCHFSLCTHGVVRHDLWVLGCYHDRRTMSVGFCSWLRGAFPPHRQILPRIGRLTMCDFRLCQSSHLGREHPRPRGRRFADVPRTRESLCTKGAPTLTQRIGPLQAQFRFVAFQRLISRSIRDGPEPPINP